MRIAMIEVGHWHAGMHLQSIQLAEDARVVAVSDARPGVAEAFAQRSGGRAYQDYRLMLRQAKPDFAVAMGMHAETPAIARHLIAAGIPCAIEKPLGTKADDIAPLIELARQRNLFVAIPLINRYSHIWRQLDELDADGRAGARSHFHFRVINGPPRRYELDGVGWMLDPAMSGGGCMRNVGIHTVDAFLRFTGGERVEVLGAALSHRVHGAAIEEFCAALLRSSSGVIGTVEAGYSYASMSGGDFEARFSCANCSLLDRDDTLQVATLDDNQTRALAIPNQGSRYDQFAPDTLARLRSGKAPIATLEDCHRAMQLIDEIYAKSVRTPHAG